MSFLKDVEKVEDFSVAHLIALVNKCGGLNEAMAVLRGEKKITLEDVIRLLLDKNGRCIPQEEVTENVCDPDTDYYFDRLTGDVDYAPILLSWEKLFNREAVLTPDEFKSHIKAIKHRVAIWPTADKPQIANLFAGPHFPVILPQLSQGDYGRILESTFLPVVESAYTESYPDRKFFNHRAGELAGQVTIVDDRHAKLIKDLESGPIVGVICYPLQGFSVEAQRQMANLMPDFVSLSGPIEEAVATAMFPKHLVRDVNTPVQHCSAVKWHDSGVSLYFSANNTGLALNFHGSLGGAHDFCSGAFFVRW